MKWNPMFSTLQGNWKIGLKNQLVCKTGGKITVFDWGEGSETTFGWFDGRLEYLSD